MDSYYFYYTFDVLKVLANTHLISTLIVVPHSRTQKSFNFVLKFYVILPKYKIIDNMKANPMAGFVTS